jgi:hypothetical protein
VRESSIPEVISARLDYVEHYVSEHPSYERVPSGMISDIEMTLVDLEKSFLKLGNPAKAKLCEIYRQQLHKVVTYGDMNPLVRDIIALTRSPKSEYGYPEERLERRIIELENELSRLRSNPALEQKVAKLEKELQKIRVASTISMEGNEKKQEDMLKRYKSTEKKVFVIMPFAPIFDDVWKGGIERSCNAEDFGCLRVDKISLSSWITEDIVNYLKMADFVISDITGNNPNVMFELGWALALEKKPIVIRQRDDPNTIPFDVKDIRYIPYENSWSGIEKLFTEICKFLKSTAETSNEKPTQKKTRKK